MPIEGYSKLLEIEKDNSKQFNRKISFREKI